MGGMEVGTVCNEKSPRIFVKGCDVIGKGQRQNGVFQQNRVLRHSFRLPPTILCGRCCRHIDVVFPINRIVSDGVKCIACDIDEVKYFLHARGHPF